METSGEKKIVTPKWSELLNILRSDGFTNPWKFTGTSCHFMNCISDAITQLNDMRFEKDTMIPYVKCGPRDKILGQGVSDYSETKLAEIKEESSTIKEVTCSLMSQMFSSMNDPQHPLFVNNVIPPASIPGMIGAITAMQLNPNIIDEHYAMNVGKAELELSAMISHLLPIGHGEGKWPRPWAPPSPDSSSHYEVHGVAEEGHGSGGIITFGGTGCYLYGIKYALTKVADSGEDDDYKSREKGFDKGKFVIMVSDQGHYCHSTVTDWCGIGSDNVIEVATKADNTMDLNDLKLKMEDVKSQGKVIIAVVPTFGSTDAGALDDIREIRKIIRDFENIDPYDKPLLYADSVTGWVWLYFRGYKFKQNPLGFDADVLEHIKANVRKATALSEADAFAVDFHKTGFSHYSSSMVMFKDYGDLSNVMKRQPAPFLQQEQYDPGLYTLETSRSAVGSVGPWATMNYFGKNGMRCLVYNLVENQHYLRTLLKQTGCTIICNDDNKFYTTLIRIYPYNYTAVEYEDELGNLSKYESVFKHCNEFQRLIYNYLYKELRKSTSPEGLSTPHISFSAGYRRPYYNLQDKLFESDGKTKLQGVFALKCYLNSPFVDHCHVELIVHHLMEARDQVIQELLRKGKHELYRNMKSMQYKKHPRRVHDHHHLIPVEFIPSNHILPNNFNHALDPGFDEYLKKLENNSIERKAKIKQLVANKNC